MTITHATTSTAFSFVIGANTVLQTWLDGTGRVTRTSVNTPRGRYLVSLIARKGFAKT